MKMEMLKKNNTIIEIVLGDERPAEFEVLEEKTADSTTEKHVPFIEELDNGYRVKVGETQEHPMLEAHYIQMIELQVGSRVYRKYLNPGDKPEATFKVCKSDNEVVAREYCNLHGLWKAVK